MGLRRAKEHQYRIEVYSQTRSSGSPRPLHSWFPFFLIHIFELTSRCRAVEEKIPIPFPPNPSIVFSSFPPLSRSLNPPSPVHHLSTSALRHQLSFAPFHLSTVVHLRDNSRTFVISSPNITRSSPSSHSANLAHSFGSDYPRARDKRP